MESASNGNKRLYSNPQKFFHGQKRIRKTISNENVNKAESETYVFNQASTIEKSFQHKCERITQIKDILECNDGLFSI